MKIALFFIIMSIIQSFALGSYAHATRLSPNMKNQPVAKIRDNISGGSGITYKVEDRQIALNNSDAIFNFNQVSQQRTISGKVTDANGQPLPGVTVVVKGTTQGTVTDTNGEYLLTNIPEDATLTFSFVGMRTQEILVGSQTNIDVVMEEEAIGLDEVVAVAYGTQRKREITGSVSSINTEEIKDMPVMNLGQRMQGKFAGVQIFQTQGQPGATQPFSIRIRGQASVNAGNAPLVVIDGFPSSTGLESISPNEIESISILKDASATSLYGSRASNGVILITTKLAKEGAFDIQFTANVGVNSVPQQGRPTNYLMNAQEFAQFKKEFYEDKAIYEGYTGGVPAEYQNPQQRGEGTDWFDLLLRDALTHNYNLSLTSGSSKFKTAVNLNYNKEEGVMINTYSERFNVRANTIFEPNDKLTLGLNLGGIYRNEQIWGVGNSRSIVALAFLMDPGLKHQNDDGTYPINIQAPGMFAQPNWYLVQRDRKDPRKEASLLSNVFGEYEFIEGLKYKLSANANVRNWSRQYFYCSHCQGNIGNPPPLPPAGGYDTDNTLNWLIENTLTYKKSFNQHNLDLLIGQSAQKNRYENTTIRASQYPDDEVEWINVATTRIGNGSTSSWSMLSYIGRLNYNYENKYLLSFAFRRDGSSRFGSNAKWANFPSLSAGWIISDEKFLDNYADLSWLKVRGSYGLTGNYNIGDYTHLANVGTVNYVFDDSVEPGRAITNLGNKDLTWEQTKQFDIGFELGLYNDRIFFTYDYYSKKTDGLLYAIDIPRQSGFSSIQANIGEFDFWGHEVSVESAILTGDFKWDLNFNVSFDRNKAVKLGTNDTPIGGTGTYWDVNRTEVGKPLGLFWGYVFDGIYMTEEEFNSQPKHSTSMVGTTRMKDVGGPDGSPDGIIDANDKTFIGDPNPDFIFGITNQFYFKNFDASIVFAGQYGGDIIDYTREWTDNLDGVFNVRKEASERWRSLENPGNGVYPRTRTGTTELFRLANSLWVEDGSYLMAKNITLGYTLPANFIRGLKNARLYLSVQNAFVITNYSGMNPEVSMNGLNGLRQGVDASFYPVPRTFSIGININL